MRRLPYRYLSNTAALSGVGIVASSGWLKTPFASDARVIFSNGDRTVKLNYSGEDTQFWLSLANKSPPTIGYLEILVDANPLDSTSAAVNRLGASDSDGLAGGPRLGYNSTSYGMISSGASFYNFGTPDIVANANSSFSNGTVVSVVIDRTTAASPLIRFSNDGITANYQTSAIGALIGSGLATQFTAQLFVNNAQLTLLTGANITRTPYPGSTVIA